jgi:hypothetical protein
VSEWWRWKVLQQLKVQAGLAMKNPRSGASRSGYWLQYFFKCFLEIISPVSCRRNGVDKYENYETNPKQKWQNLLKTGHSCEAAALAMAKRTQI